MPDEFAYDVFLSHSAQDKAVVRPLAERLRKDGLKVWFDEWVLTPESPLSQSSGEGPGDPWHRRPGHDRLRAEHDQPDVCLVAGPGQDVAAKR